MWDKIIEHFSTLEHRPLERMSLLVAGLLIFWIIEGAIPLLPLAYKKTNHVKHFRWDDGEDPWSHLHCYLHDGRGEISTAGKFCAL